MSNAPAFQHRHYKAIADIFAQAAEQDTQYDIVLALANMFQRDNGRFDRDRFLSAAKGTPSNGRDKVR